MNPITLNILQNRNSFLKDYRKQTIKQLITTLIPYFLLATLFYVLIKNDMFVFASNATGQAFVLVIKAVRVIGSVAGALFVLVGIIRFVIAHANEDGPNQQKAALMIATGIALIIVVSIISAQNLADMITANPTESMPTIPEG